MNTSPRIKTADIVEYRRQYRAARKALGICWNCKQPLSDQRRALGRGWCYQCMVDYQPPAEKKGRYRQRHGIVI